MLNCSFKFRWSRGYFHNSAWYICDSSYYHHQIGSIKLFLCCYIFPWLCAWGVCPKICWRFHTYRKKTGLYFFIIVQSYVCANNQVHSFFSVIKSPQWLYVFSSFPPPRPPLTSKQFKLNLRYLGQRKYRSGKMYWWPWPNVMVMTLINKNLLVCSENHSTNPYKT